jgi:hypothetical protein
MRTRKQFLFILIFALFLLGNVGHFVLPQIFTNTTVRHPDSRAKSSLHTMFLACNDYWADKGYAETCTINKAFIAEYGFYQDQWTIIHGSGTKDNFCAIAWPQDTNRIFRIDWRGTIREESKFFYAKLNKNPPNKIWIYEEFLPRHFIYFSSALILPLMTIILTLWAGGYPILRGKRIFPRLIAVGVIVGWTLISLITIGFDSYNFLYIPVIFSIWRAFSLIGWGNQIEIINKFLIGREKDLPDYLKNQNAKTLKKSGIYLLGIIGVLSALIYIYAVSNLKYHKNYLNQSVTFSKEIEKFIPADPSQFQKLCQSFPKTP